MEPGSRDTAEAITAAVIARAAGRESQQAEVHAAGARHVSGLADRLALLEAQRREAAATLHWPTA